MSVYLAASIALGVILGIGLWAMAVPWLFPAGRALLAPRPPDRLSTLLQRAGLARTGRAGVIAGSLIVALCAATAALAATGVPAIAVCAGAFAASVPVIVMRQRVVARRKAARVVWPDVVDHLISAIRSGQALPDSVMALAHSGPVETREHFALFATSYRATGNFALGLDELKRSLADPVADRLVETLRMSREVGGTDLTLVLRDLASYLRKDSAVRSEVEARQSWIINAARLGVAAPWIVLALLATRSEAAAAYNTPAGSVLIVSGVFVSVFAYRVMIAIGRLPAERRWFE